MAIRQPAAPQRKRAYPDSDDWSEFHGVAMSVEEFLALDDAEGTDLEYVDGIVIGKAVADRNHRNLVGRADGFFFLYQRLHGGEYGPEGRVRLNTMRYRKPDTAFYVAGSPQGNEVSPTLAIEVWSPGETMNAQRAKCRMWREHGIPVVWLFDPRTRTAEVFDADHDGDVFAAPHVLVTDQLPGFALPLAELFAVLD